MKIDAEARRELLLILDGLEVTVDDDSEESQIASWLAAQIRAFLARCTSESEPEPQSLGSWECPRCRAVHSLLVQSCGCPPPTITTTGSAIDNAICRVRWP